MQLQIKCEKHPRYEALNPNKEPTCEGCSVLWTLVHAPSMLGLRTVKVE
jgi:hypothetical protein